MKTISRTRELPEFDAATTGAAGGGGLLTTRIWLAYTVWCVLAGWLLSLLHALSGRGYFWLALVTVVILAFTGGRNLASRIWFEMISHGRKAVRRMREPLPASFFLITALVLAAGLLYVPTNRDALEYRIPRLLHWLSRGTWHWVHTDDGRQNYYGTATEWLSAPVLALAHSDRALSLLNFIPFLQLPGFIFMILRGLKVTGRTARAWMWPLAGALGFAQQASSGANDLLGLFYAAAAIGLALRAGSRGSFADWAWSAIAAALMTNAKYSNIPLCLPWLVVSMRCWPLMKAHLLRSCGVLGVAALVSCFINVWLNQIYAGTWFGIRSPTVVSAPPDTIWSGLVLNGSMLWIENLAPPLLPWAQSWNLKLSAFFTWLLGAHFENSGGCYGLVRAASDGLGGIGILVILILCSLAAGVRDLRRRRAAGSRYSFGALFLASISFSVLFLLARISTQIETARIIFPYYIPLIAGFLAVIPTGRVIRTRWWNIATLLVMLSSVPLLVISRERPLWPTMELLRWAETRWPQSKFIRQMGNSYHFVDERMNAAQPLLRALPKDARLIAIFIDRLPWESLPSESLLWEPYGARTVTRIVDTDSVEDVRKAGIRYVVTGYTVAPLPPVSPVEKLVAAGRVAAISEPHKEPEGPLLHDQLVELPPWK